MERLLRCELPKGAELNYARLPSTFGGIYSISS